MNQEKEKTERIYLELDFPESLATEFRTLANQKNKGKRGGIKKAAEEAIKKWTKEEKEKDGGGPNGTS